MDLEAKFLNISQNFFHGMFAEAGGGWIIVPHGINNDGIQSRRIMDNITQSPRVLVEEFLDCFFHAFLLAVFISARARRARE
jgi:hypothetical protein